jgi:hypothetical protein
VNRTTMLVSDGTEIEYFPSPGVAMPPDFPKTATFTPGNGLPVASLTMPYSVAVPWLNAVIGPEKQIKVKASKRNKEFTTCMLWVSIFVFPFEIPSLPRFNELSPGNRV